MNTKKNPKCIIINYMDGKRDVLELDVDFRPSHFVDDAGTLNVKGRFSATAQFDWHYFPCCNVRRFEIKDGDMA